MPVFSKKPGEGCSCFVTETGLNFDHGLLVNRSFCLFHFQTTGVVLVFLSVCVSCFVSFYLNICKLIAISFFFACAGIDKTSEGNHTVNVFF